MWQLRAIAIIVIACAASYAGVAAVRRWALGHRKLDIPNARSSHFVPTPRGGGLGLVVVTLLGAVLLKILFEPEVPWLPLLAYLGGAGLIALVSWLDDLHGLSAAKRLAAHGLGALAAVVAIGYWQTIPLLPGQSVTLGCAGAAITLIWIVGMTNAYNFMDGSDGLAASQAVIAGLGWACLGWLAGFPAIVDLSLLLAAGSIGFLLHNWPPARIFMGDVGSAFLGYSFAVLPLLGLHGGGPLADASPVVGLLFVWPFVFDAALTFLRRLRNGENVFAAHRSHLYQRLIIAGYSHRFVLCLYAGLSVAGAVAGISWFPWPVETFWSCLAIIPSLAWMLCRFVALAERRAREAAQQPEIITLPLPKRRAA